MTVPEAVESIDGMYEEVRVHKALPGGRVATLCTLVNLFCEGVCEGVCEGGGCVRGCVRGCVKGCLRGCERVCEGVCEGV